MPGVGAGGFVVVIGLSAPVPEAPPQAISKEANAIARRTVTERKKIGRLLGGKCVIGPRYLSVHGQLNICASGFRRTSCLLVG
jgi:hypothetical protein